MYVIGVTDWPLPFKLEDINEIASDIGGVNGVFQREENIDLKRVAVYYAETPSLEEPPEVLRATLTQKLWDSYHSRGWTDVIQRTDLRMIVSVASYNWTVAEHRSPGPDRLATEMMDSDGPPRYSK